MNNTILHEKLEQVISELGEMVLENEEDIRNYAVSLCDIYKVEDFRHHYSGTFRQIYGVQTPKNGSDFAAISEKADRLVNNLGVLNDYIAQNIVNFDEYDENAQESIQTKFLKLYDHASLEHTRLLVWSAPFESFDSINVLVDSTQELTIKTKDLEQRERDLQDSFQGIQKDYIAILAIFTAVIVAFSGGIGYATQSIQSVSKDSFLQLACIVLIVGLVLFNVLYALFRFVWNIIRKNDDGRAIPVSKNILVAINVIFSLLIVVLCLLCR